MQLKYFVYYVYSESTGKHYFIDLRKFIKAFCKYDNPSFKAKFIYSNEENMYLFPVQSNLYIFVMTRDNDIIKTIDKGKANYNEIYDKLQQNESLGFASYLLFTDQLYAFASTTMGPKNNSFVSMVNDIFKSIGLDNYEFMSELLRQKTTKAEILKLPVIGRTVIEVSRNHKMFDKLSGMFGKDHEIKSFEVIIKPLIKGEITKAVKHYVRNEFDEQETKFRVKAKADIDDAFSDYYLVEMGAITDAINSKDESKLIDLVLEKSGKNEDLKRVIGEFRNGNNFQKSPIQSINRFNDIHTWADTIRDI